MTTDQAERLREKWRQRLQAEPCPHYQAELEWTMQGYLTGKYVCITCGSEISEIIGQPLSGTQVHDTGQSDGESR